MVIAKGFTSRTGVGAEAAFGTPIAVTDKLPIISETLSSVFDKIPDLSLCGTATQGPPSLGLQRTQGGLLVTKRLTAQDPVIEHFFGNFTAGGGTFTDDHYLIQDSLDDNGLTVAIDKNTDVYEFTGYKVSTFQLTGTPGDGVRMNLDGFATGVDLASTINTTAVIDLLANAAGRNLQFFDMELLIGDLTNVLATPADKIKISQFTLELNRALEATEINERFLDQAVESSWRTGTLSFTLPRLDDTIGTQFQSWHSGDTPIQGIMTFTLGADNLTVYLPNMRVQTPGDANIGGPGFVPLQVVCSLHTNEDNTNTNLIMTDIDAEVLITENIA